MIIQISDLEKILAAFKKQKSPPKFLHISASYGYGGFIVFLPKYYSINPKDKIIAEVRISIISDDLKFSQNHRTTVTYSEELLELPNGTKIHFDSKEDPDPYMGSDC